MIWMEGGVPYLKAVGVVVGVGRDSENWPCLQVRFAGEDRVWNVQPERLISESAEAVRVFGLAVPPLDEDDLAPLRFDPAKIPMFVRTVHGTALRDSFEYPKGASSETCPTCRCERVWLSSARWLTGPDGREACESCEAWVTLRPREAPSAADARADALTRRSRGTDPRFQP